MTFEKLEELLRKNKISKDVKLESDSGWEGGPTDMDGVYYNKTDNVIVFTQGYGEEGYCEPDWSLLWTSKTQGNINNKIPCTEDIWLFPFYGHGAHAYEELYKNELRKNGEFEQYYGVRECDERYSLINLKQPLFWGIMVKNNGDHRSNFVGYIGFTMSGEDLDIEVYIFKEYRRKGYGKVALKCLADFAKEGRLKVFESDSQEIKPFIPEKIEATVRKDNMPSRALVESCGFKLDEAGCAVLMHVLDDDFSNSEFLNCVKYIYE